MFIQKIGNLWQRFQVDLEWVATILRMRWNSFQINFPILISTFRAQCEIWSSAFTYIHMDGTIRNEVPYCWANEYFIFDPIDAYLSSAHQNIPCFHFHVNSVESFSTHSSNLFFFFSFTLISISNPHPHDDSFLWMAHFAHCFFLFWWWCYFIVVIVFHSTSPSALAI